LPNSSAGDNSRQRSGGEVLKAERPHKQLSGTITGSSRRLLLDVRLRCSEERQDVSSCSYPSPVLSLPLPTPSAWQDPTRRAPRPMRPAQAASLLPWSPSKVTRRARVHAPSTPRASPTYDRQVPSSAFASGEELL